MEEDPDGEWQIQECSSSEESKVGWILNKGLTLGKKIVITGFVISSAPLVIPPIVVISALGFAFSVPFGLVFASYACTEKLMSKLLPHPTYPLVLDYGTGSTEEEEDLGFVGVVVMEEEEKEQMEDTKGGVVTRIELEVDRSNELQEGDVLRVDGDNGQEDVKEDGDNGQEVVKKDKQESKVGNVNDLHLPEDGDTGQKDEQAPTVRDVYELPEDGHNGPKDVKKDEQGSTVGNVYELPEDGDSRQDETTSEENEGGIEEIDQSFEDRNVNLEGSIGKMKGTNIEKPEENEEVQERRNEENMGIVPKEVKGVGKMENIVQGNGDVEDGHNIVVVGKTIEDQNGMINGASLEVSESMAEEEQKPVVDKKAVMQGDRVEDHATNDVQVDLGLERKEEYVICLNADAREIPDAESESMHLSLSSTENDKARDSTADKSADILDLPVSAKVPESTHDEVASKSEVLFSEEKIWEQIDALRAIVGYKATPHATCVDELKALYIFTGVEPPLSFNDPSDLAEVDDKLLFLMSVIGVK